MKQLLYLLTITLIIFSNGCKKEEMELNEGEPCSNFDRCINDSTLALITQINSSGRTEILKIENYIRTVVATENNFEYWGASIAPDKQHFICFRSPIGNSEKVDDYASAELWMFNIDGTGGHKITDLTSQGLRAMGMASWAPDGEKIVFCGEKSETDGQFHWNIYLTDTTGMIGIKMNTRLGYFAYPKFTNGNMNYLTYVAWPVGITSAAGKFHCEVFYSGIDGSMQLNSEIRLTNNDQFESSPSFTSDNINIIYSQTTASVSNTAINLYSYNTSNSTATKILSNNNINDLPVVCTSNDRIYFINKNNTHCFKRCGYIDYNGGALEYPYQLFNSNFYHVDAR